MGKIVAVLLVALALPIFLFLFNFLSVTYPAVSTLNQDYRNEGIRVMVYYDFFLDPDSLVFDLRGVDINKSSADVYRTLFQVAQVLKGREYDKVILSHKGRQKFILVGEYFSKIGEEYSYQKPMYLARNLPQNIYTMDGRKAYSTWEGGLFGVASRQMQDLSDLSDKWFLQDYHVESVASK